MERIYTRTYRLKNLRSVIERGIFAVPQLQREFVWTSRKVTDLLDSIYRNYPIGALLVWKTVRKNEGELRKHLHILPPFNPANRDIYFLVDGQQRLSTLWNLMRGAGAPVRNARSEELHFDRIYFNPYASESEAFFIYRARAIEAGKRLASVVEILSRSWRPKMRGYGVKALRRIEEVRRRFFAYEIFLLFCESKELAEVRESFVRVNSLGTPIGAADRAFARASQFNLREKVREAQSQLKPGFDQIRQTTILQTVALALGEKDLGERAISSMTRRLTADDEYRRRFDRAWPTLRKSLPKAVDFFRGLGVPNLGFLPSEPMIEVAALFYFHHRNQEPSRAARGRLERWFWATAVGARYTGAGFRNLLADAEFAKRLANNPAAQVKIRVQRPRHVLLATDYRRRGPLSNGFFCLLRLAGPRRLKDGSKCLGDVFSSRSNRNDKHHIFPRALLSRHGITQERVNSILNVCFLAADENQSIGQRAPSKYFEEFPNRRRTLSGTLRSHLIPHTDGRGIRDQNVRRGFKFFLEAREKIIAREFERRAGGMQLFER